MSVKFDFGSLGKAFEANWPVTVNVPQDGGTVEKQEFMARFKLLSEDEQKRLQDDTADQDGWVKAFFIGLPDAPADQFEELRGKMLATTHVRIGLVQSYVKFAQGSPAKN